MLTTVITSWIILKQFPNFSLIFATSMVTVGALVAGIETIDSDFFGYFLVGMNNMA